MTVDCNVCGRPINFKRLPGGKSMPLDPDGLAHEHFPASKEEPDVQSSSATLTPSLDQAVRRTVREELKAILSKL